MSDYSDGDILQIVDFFAKQKHSFAFSFFFLWGSAAGSELP